MAPHIPEIILSKLREIEPGSFFNGSLPRVQSSSGAIYFAKLGSSGEAAQYSGEAESLKAMNTAVPGIAPQIFASGACSFGEPYFVSEYKDIAPLTSKAADVLARRMATELHAKESLCGFGFPIPTYCGVTRLENGLFQRWDECYASMIGDLLGKLEKKERYRNLCCKGMIIKGSVIPKLLGHLDVVPVILHGDLWIGNVGVDITTGQPVIYDPASYYGHNEADLSIARIFGGFPQSFFDTYHEYRPKTEPVDQYKMRMDLYELFHYINHTVIFGGSYAGSAEQKMDNLIKALSKL